MIPIMRVMWSLGHQWRRGGVGMMVLAWACSVQAADSKPPFALVVAFPFATFMLVTAVAQWWGNRSDRASDLGMRARPLESGSSGRTARMKALRLLSIVFSLAGFLNVLGIVMLTKLHVSVDVVAIVLFSLLAQITPLLLIWRPTKWSWSISVAGTFTTSLMLLPLLLSAAHWIAVFGGIFIAVSLLMLLILLWPGTSRQMRNS